MGNYIFSVKSLHRKRRCSKKVVHLLVIAFQALIVSLVTYVLALVVFSTLKTAVMLKRPDNTECFQHGSIGSVKMSTKGGTKTPLILLPMPLQKNATKAPITHFTSETQNVSLAAKVPVTSPAEQVSSEFLLTNSNACTPSKNITLLMFVVSAASNFQNRQKIRSSWGNESNFASVKTLFIVGKNLNSTVQQRISQEALHHGDTVVGDFEDTYQNLTHKVISMLHWTFLYCPNASYVLKTDDDMLINVKKLLEFIEANKAITNTIFGHLAHNWKRHTENSSKYFVPESEYKETTYPDFLTGPAYLLQNDYIPKLYAAAVKLPYMRLEDVTITGIAANAAGIARINDNAFHNGEQISKDRCTLRKYISIHRIDPDKQEKLFSLLNDEAPC